MVVRAETDPVTSKETAYNVRLNPLLSGYIPFDAQMSVLNFFESPERTVALTRYVRDHIKWDQANFAKDMLRLVCTMNYRYEHSWPGGKTYKVGLLVSQIGAFSVQLRQNIRPCFQDQVYIPQQLKDFLTSTAAFIANRSGFVADMTAIEKQLREYFQKSNVRRELKAQGEKYLPPEERKRPYEGFTSSEEASPPKKKKPTKKPSRKSKSDVTSEDTDEKMEKKAAKKAADKAAKEAADEEARKVYRTRAKARQDEREKEEQKRDELEEYLRKLDESNGSDNSD